MADTSAGQLSATWQGLAQIPQLLTDVKSAVLTLKTLITTPAAAVATGSPPASGAIVLLGAELAMFLAQTVQAVEQDIEAIQRVRRNYETTEQGLTDAATRGQRELESTTPAPAPRTGTTPTPVPPRDVTVIGRPVPVPPTSQRGAAAVDPSRRAQLSQAGQIALAGLVDVVGREIDRVPTPRTATPRIPTPSTPRQPIAR
jgi:hypothetical protein